MTAPGRGLTPCDRRADAISVGESQRVVSHVHDARCQPAEGRVLTDVVLCSNDEGHEEGVPAAWDVTFPSGRWNACTACWECFDILLDNMRDEPETVVLVPLNKTPHAAPPSPLAGQQ